MISWFKLSNLGVVLALLVGAAAVWWAIGNSRDDSSSPQPAHPTHTAVRPATPEPSVSTPAQPASTQAIKAQLDERDQAFVAAYLSVTPPEGVADTNQALDKSAETTAKAVKPFATAHFLQTAPFGYAMYGTELGSQMLEQHAVITATPTSGLTDARISSGKAVGTVMVHFAKTDDSGTYDLGDKPQQLTLVKQGNTWFINAAPIT
jgi:hypothetical protein